MNRLLRWQRLGFLEEQALPRKTAAVKPANKTLRIAGTEGDAPKGYVEETSFGRRRFPKPLVFCLLGDVGSVGVGFDATFRVYSELFKSLKGTGLALFRWAQCGWHGSIGHPRKRDASPGDASDDLGVDAMNEPANLARR